MSAADKAKNKLEELAGETKEKVGDVTDNESLQVEGALEAEKARLKQAGEHAKDAVKDVVDE